MRHIRQCTNHRLAEIYQAALIINELNATLVHYLPEHLRAYFSVGSFHQGCLVLVTHDAIWASQLRFHLPQLRDDLRKHAGIYHLVSIKVNVCADSVPHLDRPKKCIPLSSQARQSILIGSEQCDYIPLKTALQKLALDEFIS